MVAWARMVAVGVMRSSWILERSCWNIFGMLREEKEAGMTLRFEAGRYKVLFHKMGKMQGELVWQGKVGCLDV